MLYPQTTLNCAGRLLDLSHPAIMGIINVTPDSFYVGSRFMELTDILQQAEQMLSAGAQILDIGGMSSRPGAHIITAEEEMQRVAPVIQALTQEFPEAIISLDTVYAHSVRAGYDLGVGLINDISAGRLDPAMYPTVAELGLPYVLMHMQGQPGTMQSNPVYADVVTDVLDFFIAEVGKLRVLGVKDIVLDPGFGFGKTIAHNYQLLKSMHVFRMLDVPLLAGLSRKSMIYRFLNIEPEQALNGTTALHMIALQQGAKLLRVHDVKPAAEVIKLWEMLDNE
ncbi:MAG TPA: dihydropteroate synthase [Haliscomenobacter sp.]|uniref:dihydropteroate synthase n=1 Tax=Haliscomenobacter sp. TaxID=2717303 RepID=UPI002B73983A|nr:dihydropteroate synthase [Haliscomenobacter sp.]HOY19811.1 dihydropteroate synthase [Haliscomenobacter sp.]